jgi:hypothetical protein
VAWAIILGGLICASVLAAPAVLREAVIVRLPVGAGPAAISNAECVGRRPACAAGLAILSPSDSLYFYDIGNDNVKVIVLRPQAGLARLAPGLGRARGPGEIPLSGTATADGTLRLLVGAPESRGPRTLWVLGPGATAWRRAPSNETSASAAALRRPDMPAIPGLPKGAVPLGRDGAGNWFVEVQHSWTTQVLAKYAPDGRLLAEATLPERPIWKPLVGPADKWVTSRGDLVEVYVGERWLVVTGWVEGS